MRKTTGLSRDRIFAILLTVLVLLIALAVVRGTDQHGMLTPQWKRVIILVELCVAACFAVGFCLNRRSEKPSRLTSAALRGMRGLVVGWSGLTILALALMQGEPGEWLSLAGYWFNVVAAGLALVLIVSCDWRTFEVYWELATHCPLLAIEALLMLGLWLGLVLPTYGLVGLFWGEGHNAGDLIVPIITSYMIALTFGILFLCAYFLYGLIAGAEGVQRDTSAGFPPRVSTLWESLLPGAAPDDNRKEPGHFIWYCVRPLLFVLGLVAAFPSASRESEFELLSRGGWLAGTAAAGWIIRAILVEHRIAEWVARLSQPPAARPEPLRGYPMTLNATGLVLIALPVLMSLLAVHACDFTAPPYGTRTAALGLFGFFLVVCLSTIQPLEWQPAERRRYLVVFGVPIFVPASLAAFASLQGLYLAAPFSICAFAIFVAVVSTLFPAYVSGQLMHGKRMNRRVYRRLVQLSAFVVPLLLIYANGFRGVAGRFAHGPSTTADLKKFDAWYAAYASTHDLGPDGLYGSKQLDANRDGQVLERWRQGIVPGTSDEPFAIGRLSIGTEDSEPEWSHEADTGCKPKLVVVATSGGGLRAAVWTAQVLYSIDQAIPEFNDRLRIITGSSGGMLGAAMYVTGLLNDPARPPEESISERIARELRHDFLTPVVHRMVFGDPVSLIEPWRGGRDRGQILEDNLLFKKRPTHRLDVGFGTLARAGESQGRLPSLIFTPTMVEDSRRLVISNLEVGPLTLNHGAFDPRSGEEVYTPGPDFPFYSRSGIQLFHLMPDLYEGAVDLVTQERHPLSVGAAVRLNATFPYVTPAVSLQLGGARRVVDAGYYDNYGVDLAVAWLEEHRRWLEANTSGVILIQIRAFSNEQQLKQLATTRQDPGFGRYLDEYFVSPLVRGGEFLTTPLAGIFGARMNVNYYRNDAAIENLKRSFTFDMLEHLAGVSYKPVYNEAEKKRLSDAAANASGFFRIFTFTCSSDSAHDDRESLNWYLSQSEFEHIQSNWQTIDNTRRFQFLLGAFRRWFENDDEPPGPSAPGRPRPAPPRGWQIVAPPVSRNLDDRFEKPPVHRGLGYLVAPKGADTEAFEWAFPRPIPPGTYRIAVNLPEVSGDLATDAPFAIEVEGFPTLNFPVDLSRPFQGERDANPPWWEDRLTRSQALGHWSYLETAVVVPPGKDRRVRVRIGGAPASGRLIADGIRLELEVDAPEGPVSPVSPSEIWTPL